MKIVIATHNKDKYKELYEGLKDLDVTLLSLWDFPKIKEIIEDGTTLEENALIKARTVNKITSLPAISDDTGLEVDALNGAPGLFTARYAGENCTYLDNINKMLNEMRNIPNEKRTARFKTAMVFVSENKELTSHGIVEGMIEEKIKKLGGFGYDPIFYAIDQAKTFAEMNIKEKNIISHRGKAIIALKRKLSSHITNLSKENA